MEFGQGIQQEVTEFKEREGRLPATTRHPATGQVRKPLLDDAHFWILIWPTMSNDLSTITSNQLRRAIVIKERIEALTSELDDILGSSGAANSESAPKKRKMSAAARARMSTAAKLRWKAAKAAGKKRL
jgi:hypothetical protein